MWCLLYRGGSPGAWSTFSASAANQSLVCISQVCSKWIHGILSDTSIRNLCFCLFNNLLALSLHLNESQGLGYISTAGLQVSEHGGSVPITKEMFQDVVIEVPTKTQDTGWSGEGGEEERRWHVSCVPLLHEVVMTSVFQVVWQSLDWAWNTRNLVLFKWLTEWPLHTVMCYVYVL